jgi:hypothetical protein
MKVTKIHRGIKFEETDFLKSYIYKNTELRKKAKNDFKKEFFKFMNNSCFGKTGEKIEKRTDVRLVTSEDKATKLAAYPTFESRTIFDTNLIVLHMRKTKMVHNKPVYLGQAILDHSKTVMHDFHFNFIERVYGNRAKVLFTDAGSLCYHIETEDVYADFGSYIKTHFDTGDYPNCHPAVTAGFKVGKIRK